MAPQHQTTYLDDIHGNPAELHAVAHHAARWTLPVGANTGDCFTLRLELCKTLVTLLSSWIAG